jgi:hypothetical protein
MPVEYHWYDSEKTMVVNNMIGKWSWEEWYKSNQKVAIEIAEQSHGVYYIGNFLKSDTLPSGSPLSYAASMFKVFPNNWMGTIVVSDNRLIETLVRIFAKAFPALSQSKLHTAHSIEEALELVAKLKRTEANS